MTAAATSATPSAAQNESIWQVVVGDAVGREQHQRVGDEDQHEPE